MLFPFWGGIFTALHCQSFPICIKDILFSLGYHYPKTKGFDFRLDPAVILKILHYLSCLLKLYFNLHSKLHWERSQKRQNFDVISKRKYGGPPSLPHTGSDINDDSEKSKFDSAQPAEQCCTNTRTNPNPDGGKSAHQYRPPRPRKDRALAFPYTCRPPTHYSQRNRFLVRRRIITSWRGVICQTTLPTQPGQREQNKSLLHGWHTRHQTRRRKQNQSTTTPHPPPSQSTTHGKHVA